MASELEAIAKLRAIFAREAGGVRVGIGDDAAVLEGDLVWTIDTQIEGTHFRREWVSWEDVGWRSFMAAASDLAAMGAQPIAALSALAVSDDAVIEAIARGQAAAADVVGAPIVGGNLAKGTETSITTTLIGRAAAPILRSGARAGDGLWLAGAVGLAGAGLVALQKNDMQDTRIAAWRRPIARIADGLAMARVAHAAIDVSDGLARDAMHLAEASGLSVVIDAAAIVSPSASLDLALGGGEDYALLAASDAPIAGFVRIGAFEVGPARVLLRENGAVRPIDPHGFDHFAQNR
jgi:thiamine-monophosphate kinase